MRRKFPALAGALFFLLMAVLYCAGAIPLYRGIIVAWGIDPFAFPFLDTDTVLSAVRCMNKGVDVYVVNPCDVLGRLYDYSPLWMALTVFPMTPAWLPPIGVGVDIAFLLSLLLLPAGRSSRATLLIAAGVISSASLFAVERGNNDLVLFVLAAGAAALVCRSRGVRLIAYALALLAGLLKYYPMTLMLIATREKPGRLFAIAAVSIAVVTAFMALTWHDLVRALALIPTGSYFGDMFGSVTVGGGLTEKLGLPPATPKLVRATMSIVAIAIGIAMGVRTPGRDAVAGLAEGERSFLLIGGLLILSCFFTAQNIGYRAVHLILVLPALTALYGTSTLVRFRRALPLALGLLWSEAWRHGAIALGIALGNHGHARAQWLTWIVREVMWWWLITILLSCVVSLLLASPAARVLLSRRGQGLPAEGIADAP